MCGRGSEAQGNNSLLFTTGHFAFQMLENCRGSITNIAVHVVNAVSHIKNTLLDCVPHQDSHLGGRRISCAVRLLPR